MNKVMAIGSVATMLAAGSVYGQGWIAAANDASTLVTASASAASVWGVAAGAPTPKGATGGLQGQLYYSATETGALAPLGNVANFSTLSAGRFSFGALELPATAAGSDGWFQVKVWESSFGGGYDAAVSASAQGGRLAIAGTSALFKVTAGSALQPAQMATGLSGFSVSVVPEPSTLALGALGLAGLFLIRRRN